MRQSYLAVQKATLITITSFGSRTEPMSISPTSPSPSRESETKQIDHNGSIRSTYMSIEDIKAMGASVASQA
jgi:cyclic beta-1,2-glucan synthetase